jgi:hypothetical protein
MEELEVGDWGKASWQPFRSVAEQEFYERGKSAPVLMP